MRPAAPRLVLLAALAIAAAAAGCVSATGAPQTGPDPHGKVRDIELSERRGEVGKPFTSTLTWTDNYIRQPEFKITGLPPGLFFDPESRSIQGTPKREGFFTVNVALRQLPRLEANHRPDPDERWWPASFEIQIFAPLKP